MGLVGPDEPRYVWIARAMASTGDWITPRLYGQPWFEKPILYYWAAALGFLLHLPAEWAARLPSAFAALAAAIAIGLLAARHYAQREHLASSPAFSAPLLFAASVAAVGFARAATPDMIFSAFIAMAMAAAATMLRRRGLLRPAAPNTAARSDIWPLTGFGIFLGLATLAKGPAALILAGGSLLLWALATGRWREVLRFAHPCAMAAFCVVAVPWYAICALRNPEFLRVFIFEHNFERYLTPVFQHPQPFWFFVPITLLAVLPWTSLLWLAAMEGRRLWREKSWRDSPGLFFACWAIFPIVFFSLSQSKLPGYILPSVPPLALLCAAALARSGAGFDARRNSLKFTAAAFSFTWLVLGLAALVWMHRLPMYEHQALRNPLSAAAIIALLGGVHLAFLAFRRDASFFEVSLIVVALVLGAAGVAILPRLDPFVSARWHAQLLQNDRHPDRVFTYRLSRSWVFGLNFYLRRELPEWSPPDPNPALVLTTPAGLSEIRRLHRFYGTLEENDEGILYVPIGPAPR